MDRENLRDVVAQTEVLRAPKQLLSTFGTTCIQYFLLTEPVYEDTTSTPSRETVVRRGTVTSARPQIITPYYLFNLFQGFEHGQQFARYLHESLGPNAPGLMYSYRNELTETSIVSEPLSTVAGRLSEQLERDGAGLTAVLRGVDYLWDVSLMKLIFDVTIQSIGSNVADLDRRGLLASDGGIPHGIRRRLEKMFAAVAQGDLAAPELKAELDRWGLFAEYEDRFLDLFRGR